LTGIDETEVLVVDNHSRDGSVDYLSYRFPDVNFIKSNHNIGFARANNMAIKQCHGEYILLLNPDTIVGESTLNEVVHFMENHPKAGGVGVRMIKTDGTDAMESRRGLPTPMTSFYKMCGLGTRYPQSRRFGRYYMSYLSWDEPVRIEVISGAFCMLRKEAIENVGMLDEEFFMYGEDIDLSFRLLKSGYENWYVPSRILHYKGESTQKSSFRYVHVFYGAMLIFFKKHYGHLSVFLGAPVKFAIYFKAAVELVRMKIRQVRKSLGFFSVNKTKQPLYVFIGSPKAIQDCQIIAHRNGLEASFYTGDSHSLPDGHINFNIPDNVVVYIVYDTDAYCYDTIMTIFARQPRPNIYIGTYNTKTKIIITGDEILK